MLIPGLAFMLWYLDFSLTCGCDTLPSLRSLTLSFPQHEQADMPNMTVAITRLDPEETADVPLPKRMSSGAAGMDVFAAVREPFPLAPGETAAIPTGFAIAVPEGYEAQVRPRSGLALKKRIGLLNSPGTIDSDYRGEVKIILTNFSADPFVIERGDRIAQMVICPVVTVDWVETDDLDTTDRGAGGFGHTGV